jgi:hypothetical protein
MNDHTKKTQRSPLSTRALEVGVAACLAMSTACGPSGPPPHVAEVPIEQFSTGPGAPPSSPSSAPAVDVATTDSAPSAPSTGSSTSPTPLPTNDTPAPSTTPATPHARPPRGQRLTAGECSRIMDRYIVLVGMGQGLTAAQAAKAIPTMKAAVASDPSYAGAQSSCLEQNSKKQYQCALKASSLDAWKACLE